MEIVKIMTSQELSNRKEPEKFSAEMENGHNHPVPAKLTEPKNFSRLPKRKPVDIRFDDLAFTAKLGFRKGEKKIVHEVCGRFLPSQLIAIMGPSGAGKSTMLDMLSGYRISGISGSVMVDGVERELDEFRRMSCYITQDDRLHLLLTTRENMRVAADLKLGVHVPPNDKNSIIDEILTTLGLISVDNTRAGRLSGGQKKRLSIAMELINNPLIMFLDEPTTGLDSSSCMQCISLLKVLARQGRTIVCTIHQPSASLFLLFDHVYVLSEGRCLYQGSTNQLVPYLSAVGLPCPMYHNPADYVIELACGEYGEDKIDIMVAGAQNGKNMQWFENSSTEVEPFKRSVTSTSLKVKPNKSSTQGLQETSQWNQIKVLLGRGFLKSKRDSTLTHMRILVNIFTGIMLGVLYIQSGNEGSRVLDNYNLLFTVLIHHMMTTMMLTILTFPTEMSILQKEHFNRWYSLKSYYISVTIVDIPVSVVGCVLFSLIIYFMSGQPIDGTRFSMFFAISMFIVFVAQSFGLMIGAIFDVVNGTFLGPTLAVPMMMFSGFGVSLRDLPVYLKWGSYISFLRYGLEGYVGAIYGLERQTMDCSAELYCHYKYPYKFLNEIGLAGDQFWNDIIALSFILLATRTAAYFMLRWKLRAVR